MEILPAYLISLVAVFLLPGTQGTASTLDSCPDHCYCFVVSRNIQPPTALLYHYIQANHWNDGSKAIACWGRKEVPKPLSSDLKYLLLIGSQKPKRRRHSTSLTRDQREDLKSRTSRTHLLTNPFPLRRRNIWSVPDGAFEGLREIIEIDLHGNKVLELRPSTFQDMSKLMVLNLNQNRLKSLHLDLFQDAYSLEKLHVAGNLLRSLPEGLFHYNRRIERLDLSDNLLATLSDDCFQPLSNLKFLNLSFNRIDEMSNMVFTGLSQLTELNLKRNKFNRLDTLLFMSNMNLKKLDMSYNRIKDIAPNALQNLQILEELDLSENQLTTLNNLTFFGASAMHTLDLSSNHIDHIMPGAFDGLPNITKLYMRGNNLRNITKSTFGDMPSLTYLTLARNNISSIVPYAMMGLQALEYLDLSGNHLHHLMAHTFQGILGLMELNLADNQLLVIEPEAFKTTTLWFMSKLTWLNLQGNNLIELQRDVFIGAPSLRVLTLSKNRISRVVPEAFGGFNRLHRLMMSDNSLSNIPDRVFRMLRTLEILDLRNNSLREISDSSFKGLDRLKNLNLAENALTNENMKWLKPLKSIQTLNLNGNHFIKMSSKDFEVATNLRYLYLSNNNLTMASVANDSRLYLYNLTMSHNSLTNLEDFSPHILAGRALDLAHNPWHCDCRLVSLFSDMIFRSGIRLDKEHQTTCKTPNHLKGAHIMRLVQSDVQCNGPDLDNVILPTATSTTKQETTKASSISRSVPSDSALRWSWVAILWDSATDMPVCNGALVSTNFVITSYQCLKRMTNIHSHLQLVSQCPQPLDVNCQDKRWAAPSNMEIKVSRGQRTLTNFLLVAETFRVLRIHKVSSQAILDDSSPVLLQMTHPVDVEGSASVIDILDEGPQSGDLEGKRLMASGWWIDRSRVPEAVGRQKRRHYRITSSLCGSQNDVNRPFLCGHLEQALAAYQSWDSLGAPVSIRKRHEWKLIGFLSKQENEVGFIKDLRQERERIQQIIAEHTLDVPVTHPY